MGSAGLRGWVDPEHGWRLLDEADPRQVCELGASLVDRLSPRLRPESREIEGLAPDPEAVQDLRLWLDATRRSPFLRRIAGTRDEERWLDLVLAACERTDYTVGALFRQRVERRPHRPWLITLLPDRSETLTLGEAARRVEALARSLIALFPGAVTGQPVALYTENSVGTVLADLACLTTGLVDLTIPADLTGEQAAYILEQTEARLLFVGSDRQMEKVRPLLSSLPRLQWVVQIGPVEGPAPAGPKILPLSEFLVRGENIAREEVERRAAAVRWGDPATLMFTSGTTGLPKGILFSHRNLISKRFARALAWPSVGEEDHFLCFLPLYHTFGRYLEMLGSLFWDATYTFMENPSVETMLENFRRAAPTIFISIPKKWIQLAERIQESVGEGADPRLARPQVERITGGRLRRGLSAAGYLDPAVFRFFQRHGVELMSGFGMTEATGGITMTPPGEYREGTVGCALPGIELKRDEDGELLVRGPYVMEGYFGPDEIRHDYTKEWFHTGDIVDLDPDGFVTIVDRKKDIYKNVKGQTISPQRVESLFQPFGEVHQVFLVGDGREYNTVLIHPDFDFDNRALRKLSPESLREVLGTIIVSVNGFLAPYERILDFAILSRPLSLENEELTPKGTFRRKVVEEHFSDLITGMYLARFSRLRVGEIEVRLPHWLLRELGITLQDVAADPDALRLVRSERRLRIARFSAVAGGKTDLAAVFAGALAGTAPADDGSSAPAAGTGTGSSAAAAGSPGRVLVGDLIYGGSAPWVDLEQILRTPDLWLGNAALVEFTGRVGVSRPQPRPERFVDSALHVAGMADVPVLSPEDRDRMEEALWREDRSLLTLHAAAVALLTADEREGLRLIEYFENVAREEDAQRAELARIALRRTVGHPLAEVRSAAFRALLPNGAPEMVGPTFRAFLAADPAVMSEAGARALARRGLPAEIMTSYLAFLSGVQREREYHRRSRRSTAAGLDESRSVSLLRFLVVYASNHPAWYRAARAELTRWLLSSETQRVRQFAARGLERLTRAFREWLGPHPRVAVEPHTGREYGWDEILRFDPACPNEDRERIRAAIHARPLVKEAIFILYSGVRVSMADIPRGGIGVTPLGSGHARSVYRLSVQTAQSGTFEIALNLARGLTREQMESEVNWLLRLGGSEGARPLVEAVGGFWPEDGFWTEEFVPGENILQLVSRVAGEGQDPAERLIPLWVHLAASASHAYIDFWERTGRQIVPGDPSPQNLIVPAHDYQEASRLISIAERRPYSDLPTFFRSLKEGVLDAVPAQVPQLKEVAGTDLIYSAVLDVVGEREGEAILEELAEKQDGLERELPGESAVLRSFLDRVRSGGHMPRRLAAAIRRYHRWAAANTDATRVARARTLSDLWESYGLRDLEEARPETRLRLFRETVFANASEPLRAELARLIGQARLDALSFESLLREMSEIVRRLAPSEEEIYFLARMTYAHLRPMDTADLALVEQGGTRISDLVVTHRDRAGHYVRIRHAASPREVWDLYRMLREAGLPIRFRPGHQFLVAVDETGKLLGGLFYRIVSPETVHLEKIVVLPARRQQGISEELMEDFFDRLRARGIRSVTTGFYRPQYFRKFRFQVDRDHPGLVRELDV